MLKPTVQMTVQELLYDAVKYEYSLLAHAVFIGVQRGLFKLQDTTDKIDYSKLPMDEVVKANERNDLKIKFTKLYALRRPHHAQYAYYLAEDKESALKKHRELFNEEPLKIYDQSDKKYESFVGEHEPLRKAKTFWDCKEVAKLPQFICLMEAKRKC